MTDLDSIENSNLSRQFLFREKDVGRMKSHVAAERAIIMNPESKIRPMTTKIGNLNPMPAEFWNSKSVVINALDNVQTRQFVDKKCVEYCKPLLESGTQGQKANMQVILPRVTQIYSAMVDMDTGEAPACTIHNFPNTITHCIVYATSEFKGMFESAVEDLKKWQESAQDMQGFVQFMQSDLTSLKGRFCRLLQLIQDKVETEEDCYRFAARQFKRFFQKMIARILETNPLDSTNQDGSPFWSADKRPPHVLQFSMQDPIHKSFAKFGAKLVADVFGLQFEFNEQKAAAVF